MFPVTFLFKPSRVNFHPTKEKEYNRRRMEQTSKRYATNFRSAQTAVPKMETLKSSGKKSKKKAVR